MNIILLITSSIGSFIIGVFIGQRIGNWIAGDYRVIQKQKDVKS